MVSDDLRYATLIRVHQSDIVFYFFVLLCSFIKNVLLSLCHPPLAKGAIYRRDAFVLTRWLKDNSLDICFVKERTCRIELERISVFEELGVTSHQFVFNSG